MRCFGETGSITEQPTAQGLVARKYGWDVQRTRALGNLAGVGTDSGLLERDDRLHAVLAKTCEYAVEIRIGSDDAQRGGAQTCALRRAKIGVRQTIRDGGVREISDCDEIGLDRLQQGQLSWRLSGIEGGNPGHVRERASR